MKSNRKGFRAHVEENDEVNVISAQLEVARSHIDYHTEKFGYSKPNVEFREGYIEQLDKAGLQDNSFDIIM